MFCALYSAWWACNSYEVNDDNMKTTFEIHEGLLQTSLNNYVPYKLSEYNPSPPIDKPTMLQALTAFLI